MDTVLKDPAARKAFKVWTKALLEIFTQDQGGGARRLQRVAADDDAAAMHGADVGFPRAPVGGRGGGVSATTANSTRCRTTRQATSSRTS